jgi:dihydrofolate reductase
MKKLIVFNNVTLDGYFTDKNGDMSWAHKDDPEWNEFVSNNASGGGVLILGRITYELMASYWPTPMAAEQYPVVADAMNELPKLVFSRTLDEPTWENAKIIKGDLVEEIEKLKAISDLDMVILGSGTIVSQLARAGLIDEYQIVVHPIVVGDGRTLFEGIDERMPLNLTSSRIFKNGAVLLHYAMT